MAKQIINVGTVANDGTGDKPRPAGIKINENFTELYDAVAALEAVDPLFLGLYTSLGALETAHPTADSGQYAIVDPGPGTDAVKYLWDEDEGWVEGGSSGGGDFLTLTGDPYDNTALSDALRAKLDSLPTYRDITGAHTLDATDLSLIEDGDQAELRGNSGGALTVPLNATVAFPNGTLIAASGFTGSVIATGGVTINGTRGDLTIPTGSKVFLEKTATDTWTLYNGEPDASETVKGLVELATTAEVVTGTDTTRATTPAGVKAVADTKAPLTGAKTFAVAFSDPTSAITAGTGKVEFPAPYDMTLTGIFAGLKTPQASGSTFTIDVNKNGATILSTKITIENTEDTSLTATTQPVISVASITKGDMISIDVDAVGDGSAVSGTVVFEG